MTDFDVDQLRQRDDRDRAVRVALFHVDDLVLRDEPTATALRELPLAAYRRIVVEAALGYLIGAGLVQLTPAQHWPQYLGLGTPEHLRTDVDAYLAADRHVQAALVQRPGGEPA